MVADGLLQARMRRSFRTSAGTHMRQATRPTRVERADAGRIVLGAGAAALLLLLVLVPMPTTLHHAADDPSDAPRRVLGHPIFVERYDAERDATLVVARFCSHMPCGPMVWVRGDWRDRLPREPMLFVRVADDAPAGDPLPPTAAPAPENGTPSPPRFPPLREASALDAAYEMRAPHASFWSYALALGALVLGAALAPRTLSTPAALVVGAVALAAFAWTAWLREGWLLLGMIVRMLMTLPALAGAAWCGVALGARQRLPATGWALALAGAALYLGTELELRHFPPSGAGD